MTSVTQEKKVAVSQPGINIAVLIFSHCLFPAFINNFKNQISPKCGIKSMSIPKNGSTHLLEYQI
jgi:hypothetical protein